MRRRRFLGRTAIFLSSFNFLKFPFRELKAAETYLPAGSLLPTAVNYETGTWDPLAFGNHRAVLEVAESAAAVWARIPWRRPDLTPEAKDIILVEAETGRRIDNRVRVEVNSSFGDIVFEAQKPGAYHAYYLPSFARGKREPSVSYHRPEDKGDPDWIAKNGLGSRESLLNSMGKLPRAKIAALQAVDEFNSFFPMEVVATAAETSQLLASHPDKAFLLFPEDRTRPIKMTRVLPLKWIDSGPASEFRGDAAPGEYYSFQIGLYAIEELPQLSVHFSKLKAASGNRDIPAAALRCLNSGGNDSTGKPFANSLSVARGEIRALWCAVSVPEDAPASGYSGSVTVHATGFPPQTLKLTLTVAGDPLPNHGDNEPARLSRLLWLDSTLAHDDEVVQPFKPVQLAGNVVSILGRQLAIGQSGLPSQVLSYFSPEGTSIDTTGKPLLDSPVEMVAVTGDGRHLSWKKKSLKITRQNDSAVEWTATSLAGSLRLEIRGRMEFDGFVRFNVTVMSTRPIALNDLRCHLPLLREKARFFMGLGLQGQACPANFDWKWSAENRQDGAWLGDTDAGLQFKLKGENYRPPLLTNHFSDQPLNLPPAWHNAGRGGISLRTIDRALLVSCFGGPRKLEPGEKLHFDFDLLLTPFKTLDTREHWRTRYFHSYQTVDAAATAGANVINVHHGNDLNPYINYPFLRVNQMRAFIDEAHQKNLKVKIYYTLRELSNHAAELYALRALGDEIFPTGAGKGDAWLQEHLRTDYIAAWFVRRQNDAAIVTRGTSRLDNYYVEGLAWLVRHLKIDGLYLDDLDYGRDTMKRVRKVLDRGRPGSLIDLHSANQFTVNKGFASCANVYLEHFPFLDRLWFGEFFDPDSPPDFWLLEMSGIPFGLMGEMLQNGGNRWRGMLYGMTSRLPYLGSDPTPLWRVWDKFRIQDSQMFGYWSPRCPVKTGHPKILATAYVARGKTLVSIASWAEQDTSIQLSIDWKALGIDSTKAVLDAWEIKDFQPAAVFKPTDPIPVPQGKGWLLYLASA